MRRGIFGENDFLDVLIEQRARDFGRQLRELGAGIAVEIALQIGKRDHPLADTDDDVRRNRRLAVTGDGDNDEECEEKAKTHAARRKSVSPVS